MVYRENNPRILEMKRMKTAWIKIMRFLPVLLVWVMATGCLFNEKDNSNSLQSVFIQVDVAADQITKSAPAVVESAEKAINSIRIYAFYNGQLSGHFLRETQSDDPIIMDLMLPYTGTHNVDFYVIANEKGISPAQGSPAIGENTTQEQLRKICLDALADPQQNGLPLYCHKVVGVNVDNLSSQNAPLGHTGHHLLAQQVEFQLERPVSKLGVYVAESEEGSAVYQTSSPKLVITGVEVANATVSGYLFDANDASGSAAETFASNQAVSVTSVIGEQNGNAIADAGNYTQVLAPHYFFENTLGGSSWSSGYVEQQTDLAQIAQGAMILKIGYSFDSGATSQYAYVKMPDVERNVFYKVMCRFSPVGGHQEVLISINEWNYITHTYDEIIVKSK